MKSFKEYINEAVSGKPGKIEIGTLKAKEYVPKIEKLGLEVQTADDEGLVVVTKSEAEVKKLNNWLMKNGWDKEDIKALYS